MTKKNENVKTKNTVKGNEKNMKDKMKKMIDKVEDKMEEVLDKFEDKAEVLEGHLEDLKDKAEDIVEAKTEEVKKAVRKKVAEKPSKVIKWTNIYSNETGYVQMIKHSKNHFVNTTEKENARKYRSEKEARKAIDSLIEMGEGRENVFSIEE